jgi:hypothetical protein
MRASFPTHAFRIATTAEDAKVPTVAHWTFFSIGPLRGLT